MSARPPLVRRLVTATLLLLVLLPVALAPWIAPQPPDRLDDAHRLEAPSLRHWAGTDELGRCVLSRALHGGRASLVLSAAVVLGAAGLGLLLGAGAAGLGGLADRALLRAGDLLLVLPPFVVALVALGTVGASPLTLVLVLLVLDLPVYARVARAAVRAEVRAPYVLADRALGIPFARTWRRTLLPAATVPVLSTAVLRLGRTLLTLAGLGFLGLGVPPPAPEWGSSIAGGRTYVRVAPWIVVAPGLCVIAVTLAATLLANGLSRRVDPRLRGGPW